MPNTYKIKVTETVTRSIEIEVSAHNADDAIAQALQEAKDLQPTDWDYDWNSPAPTASEVVSVG
jgi:hypothetical protein